MKNTVGYFTVLQPDGKERIVVVSQDITTDKNSFILTGNKVFTLDKTDGEIVLPGSDQRSFITKKRMVLKVIGHGTTRMKVKAIG